MTYFSYFSSRGHGEGAARESASIQEAFPGIGPKQCRAISILRPDISRCQCLYTTENASVSQGWDPAASFQGRVPRRSAYVVIILTNSPLSLETDNTEWERFTTPAEQDGK